MLITDIEIDRIYKLLLEDVVGVILHKLKLYIDASGLQNGLRRLKDGHSYFGIIDKKVYNNIIQDNDIINDYVLNVDTINFKNKIIRNNTF